VGAVSTELLETIIELQRLSSLKNAVQLKIHYDYFCLKRRLQIAVIGLITVIIVFCHNPTRKIGCLRNPVTEEKCVDFATFLG
jgi:hypothetical protein